MNALRNIAAVLILAALVGLVMITSPCLTKAAVCCSTCHSPASCRDCHAAAQSVPAPEPEPERATPAPFDPDTLTRSQFGPDGTYYVYVVGVHYEHEELEPGGLIYEAQLLIGDSGVIEIVGPGEIIADDQGEDPALYGETDATATIDETVTP